MFHILINVYYISQLDDLFSITCIFSGKNKLSTFPIQIKLLQELVDRFSSVNPPKRKFATN